MTQDLPLPFTDVTATTTGLALPLGLPFEEWQLLGEHLFVLRAQKEAELQAILWWIGDWIRFGETAPYGEKYVQAISTTSLSPKRLQNIVWVSEAIDFSRRREGLSFKHHSTVAALFADNAPLADALLAEAEREGWSTRKLYRERLDREAVDNGQDPDLVRAERALGRAREAVEALPAGDRAEVVARCLLGPLGLN